MLTSFAPSAFAVAPQDVYSWVKNIGTAGCPPVTPTPEQISPSGIAFGNENKVYVATYSSQIYVFSSSGDAIKKFGSNGTGNGQFNNPQDMTTDSSGNLYVVDRGNRRIQKFDADGNFLMKFGTSGTGNGQFMFGNSASVAFDTIGNIIVLDDGNNRVQKFDSNGVYMSQFSTTDRPMGMAIDGADNILISFRNYLARFSPLGATIATIPITTGSGDGQLDDGLYGVLSLRLDAAGNIYIGDSGNSRIQKFDADGNFLMKFGTPGTGNGQFGSYAALYLAIDAANTIWVADGNNYPGNFQKFDSSGNFLFKITQYTLPAAPDDMTQLCYPQAIARSTSGKLYVTDPYRHNVKVYNPDGTIANTFGSFGSGNGQLLYPAGIALGISGDIYVVNAGNSRIEIFNPDGAYKGQFGSAGTGNGQFSSLMYSFYYGVNSIAVGNDGSIYVVDTGTSRIEKFSADGTYLDQFSVTVDGAVAAIPFSITVDSHGMFYATVLGQDASDNYISVVQKYTSDGTFVSQFGSFGTGDGQLNAFTSGIQVDDLGQVYIADSGNNRIQKFDTHGNYLSQFGVAGSGDSEFSQLKGITIDSNGNVYAADMSNQRISVWNAPIVPTAPRSLTQKSLSGTSTRLSWSAPSSVGTLEYTYMVQYRVKGTTAWKIAVQNLPSSTTSFDLDLTAGTIYDVQVLAVNSIGASPAASLSFVMMMSSDELAETGISTWVILVAALLMVLGSLMLVVRSKVIPRGIGR